MMDSLLLYKILKNRTGAEISASGNPAIMPDTLKNNPMNEMKVFGWSKQETTKGKNLFDFSRLVSDGVNVMDYDNQTITVPARTNNTGYNQTLRDLCPGITPGTYAFSAKRSNPESGNGSYFLEAGLDFPFNVPTELTDALLDNHIAWYNNPDSEVENVISEIQIEIGTEATDYTPYRESQSLSISISTRLPAIPVDSDGNYTDANGQQWISDYVDLKRGKYVQNVGTMDLNDMQWRKDDNYISSSTVLQNFKGEANRVISSFVRFAYNYGGDCFFLDNNGAVYFGTEFSKRFSTLELFQVYLQEHDSIILYQLAEPIECDLTPEEIQAYKNLVTYAGTTIVENDAECYMEVSAGGGDALRAKKLALILGD